MTFNATRRRGPRKVASPSGKRVVSFSTWPETLEALDAYANAHGLYRSGAAHLLIRQALGLAPIPTDTES